MKSLFPDMEAEIRQDREALRRELAQHARQWLKGRDISWLINRLIEKGPQAEVVLLLDRLEDCYGDNVRDGYDVLTQLHALWLFGKLWKRRIGPHPSGEVSYLYGIRRVHAAPAQDGGGKAVA